MDHPSLTWPRSIITPAICLCSRRINFCSSVICFALGRSVSQNCLQSSLAICLLVVMGKRGQGGDWEQREVALVMLLLAAFLAGGPLSDCQRFFCTHLTLSRYFPLPFSLHLFGWEVIHCSFLGSSECNMPLISGLFEYFFFVRVLSKLNTTCLGIIYFYSASSWLFLTSKLLFSSILENLQSI